MWKHCKCQKDDDAKKLHQTFEPTLCKKQNTKTEVKHTTNEETGVYNPLDILKLVAGDGTVGFFKTYHRWWHRKTIASLHIRRFSA